MKNKKLLRISLFLVSLIFQVNLSTAQIVGADAFIKGTSVEIGIAGSGGFEGAPADSTTVPAGMHWRSGGPLLFGFVSNPLVDGWANSNGFGRPGSIFHSY